MMFVHGLLEVSEMRVVTTKNMGLVEWALLLILSMLWGGSFFFGKVALA